MRLSNCGHLFDIAMLKEHILANYLEDFTQTYRWNRPTCPTCSVAVDIPERVTGAIFVTPTYYIRFLQNFICSSLIKLKRLINWK